MIWNKVVFRKAVIIVVDKAMIKVENKTVMKLEKTVIIELVMQNNIQEGSDQGSSAPGRGRGSNQNRGRGNQGRGQGNNARGRGQHSGQDGRQRNNQGNSSRNDDLWMWNSEIDTVQLNSKLTLECRDSRVIFNLFRVTRTHVFSRARELSPVLSTFSRFNLF